MADPAVIFYFSGTGNTAMAARLLAGSLESAGGSPMQAFPIEDILLGRREPRIPVSGPLGFGYPVHAFNAPRIFYEFLRRLPPGGGRAVFLFKTSGDPLCHGGATAMVRRRLRKRGYRVFHESLFVMPPNVVQDEPLEFWRQLYLAAVRQATAMAAEILAGRERLQPNGALLQLATGLFSGGESLGARFFGRYHLRADKRCTHCGHCLRGCPTGNIREKNGSVRFGWRCVLCLRCVYNCPAGAIRPRMFGFFVVKNWRDLELIAGDDKLAGDYAGEDSRGYYARVYRHINSF